MVVNYHGKKFYNIGPGSLRVMGSTACFAKAISYNRKMFIKLTTGANLGKLYSFVTDGGPK